MQSRRYAATPHARTCHYRSMHSTSDGGTQSRSPWLPSNWASGTRASVRTCPLGGQIRGVDLSSWFKLLLWISAVTVLVRAENSLNHSTPGYIPQARKNDLYDSHDSYDTSETSENFEYYVRNATAIPPAKLLLDRLNLAQWRKKV